MRFNEVITRFRNNERLPEIELKGGEAGEISIFRDYIDQKRRQAGWYTIIYILIIIVLILFSIITVIRRDSLSDTFKYVFASEGGVMLVFVGLLKGVVKVHQNSMELLFLLYYFEKKPDEQKKVLDAVIDDIKKRRRFF